MEDIERGRRLKEERERLGLSQTSMASLANASKGSQILYEKGKPPTADYLKAIAAAGADVTYILTGRRERPASELTDRARLLAAIEAIEEGLGDKRLPPDKKAEAILLAYELLAEPTASRDNVVELIRRVA
ncbi:MAG: helix-turn-helix domain-containing protein [Thermomonas hydrothermalis]|uniref:helix-turn-helix domain-containing protein n=1 Tax=Thermomonas hydrothermalis TaxID=213588 RepID=UPI002354D7BA|nr:helix-turn-helix transcriptional regulator [Thermomonas hydrothermalis]MCL6619462.1 helix-turn-helix domain-containing protein [Thermomonas hydrothermalis]